MSDIITSVLFINVTKILNNPMVEIYNNPGFGGVY